MQQQAPAPTLPPAQGKADQKEPDVAKHSASKNNQTGGEKIVRGYN